MVIKFIYNSLNYKLEWIVTIHDECDLVINKFSYDKCLLSLSYTSILRIITSIVMLKRLHHLLLNNKCT